MPKHRYPDLRIKVELARAAARSAHSGWLSGRNISACMSPNVENDDEFANNKRLAGALMCDDVTLRNLACALEYMVTNTVDADFVKNATAFARKQTQSQLYPEAIAGTYQQFAQAILRIAQGDTTAERLAETVWRMLRLEAVKGKIEPLPLEIDGTPDSNTPLSQRGRERIVFQPGRNLLFLAPGTPVQFHVPARAQGQLLYAFEHRDDVTLIHDPWEASSSWLGARYQRPNVPGSLLDGDTIVEPVKGVFQIQAVGLDLPRGMAIPDTEGTSGSDEGLLGDLLRLIKDTPTAWPTGYAKTLALLVIAPRLEESRRYRSAYGVRAAPDR